MAPKTDSSFKPVALLDLVDQSALRFAEPAGDGFLRQAIDLRGVAAARRPRGARISIARGEERHARRPLSAQHALFHHLLFRHPQGGRHRRQFQSALCRARDRPADRGFRHDDHGDGRCRPNLSQGRGGLRQDMSRKDCRLSACRRLSAADGPCPQALQIGATLEDSARSAPCQFRQAHCLARAHRSRADRSGA